MTDDKPTGEEVELNRLRDSFKKAVDSVNNTFTGHEAGKAILAMGKLITALETELSRLKAEGDREKKKYYDLIFQVQSKFENESRHETAKRFIIEAEKGNSIAYAETPTPRPATEG